MKNFIFIFSVLMFLGCSSGSGTSSPADSMNAIEDHPLQDTQVSPNPNG